MVPPCGAAGLEGNPRLRSCRAGALSLSEVLKALLAKLGRKAERATQVIKNGASVEHCELDSHPEARKCFWNWSVAPGSSICFWGKEKRDGRLSTIKNK